MIAGLRPRQLDQKLPEGGAGNGRCSGRSARAPDGEAVRLRGELPSIGGRPGDFIVIREDGSAFLIREIENGWQGLLPELAAFVDACGVGDQASDLRAVG